MALILRKACECYNILFDEWTDPRTHNWPLVAKPYQIFGFVALYLMFILKWGPKWMKHREPLKLDNVLIIYNASQVVACAYLFVNSIIYAWGWNYKWICEPVDFSNNPTALRIAQLTYMYYMLKIIDLLDTVFFVLRKKGNQVSFLHIYHHTGMVLLIWGAVTYLPGGHGTLVGVINSFVHVVMYSYYLYTVINPAAKQSLWWKKHITQLQILQFFWLVLHMSAVVVKTDCEYPRWTAALFLPQNLFILILFVDFYIKTYVRKPKSKKQNGVLNNKTILNGKDVSSKNGTTHNGAYKNGVAKSVTDEKGTLVQELEKNGKVIENVKPVDKNSVNINGNGLNAKYGKNE